MFVIKGSRICQLYHKHLVISLLLHLTGACDIYNIYSYMAILMLQNRIRIEIAACYKEA